MWSKILVVIILILYILHIRYKNLRKQYKNKPTYEYKQFKKHIKPGDIVLTHGDWLNHYNLVLYVLNNICQHLRYPDTMITHAGVVVEHKGKLCICHMNSTLKYDEYQRKYNVKEPTINDLEDFIMTYEGFVTILQCHNPDIHNNLIMSYYKNNDPKLTTNINRWFFDIGLKKNWFKKPNENTCYEYLYYMLCRITNQTPTKNYAISNTDLYKFLLANDYHNEIIIKNVYFDKQS